MDILLSKTCADIISHFITLSSNDVKAELVQRYWRNISEILEFLKPVLDEAVGSNIALNEELTKALEELDAAINEASGLVSSWHQMTSKVYFVLRIESVIARIKTAALGICHQLDHLLVRPTAVLPQSSIEKITNMYIERTSDVIKAAIQNQKENVMPMSEIMEKISNSLKLSSNQELLMEVVALEKLKSKIARSENHAELEHLDCMIALVTYIHDCHVKEKQLHSINGVPIPADFCCPLSLELMSDPVIVASGQTYERAFIRKWLDEGFNVCPKTRQTLGHTNLIPNYTVKALIANWCESNDIKLPDPIKSVSLNPPSAFLSTNDSSAYDIKISHSGQSPRFNHSRSPESNRSMINSHNGSHQEAYLHEELISPSHHPITMGSALHSANGIATNIAKISSVGSEGKKESCSQKAHGSSSGPLTSQGKQESCQASSDGEQFVGHNRNVSASSAVSSNDCLQGPGDTNVVSWASSDLAHYSSDGSGEVTKEGPSVSTTQREPEYPLRLSEARSRSQTLWRRQPERFASRNVSSPSMDSRPDLSGVETEVRKLIEDLKIDSVDSQRAATAELRLLAKHNMENRIVIANCGAISLLVDLLHSADQKIQENAVTALLNLSINDNNKTAIANANAIDPLIHVLETGNPEAKENSAATLFSLSVIEENKVKIGRSGAIRPLVELLGNGTPRGKKDAATALFNLSIFHENKAKIVQAGAVKHLVDLMDPAAGMVDKAVAVLANLATIAEGRSAIGHEGGIPVLVEVVELGSARGKENAAAALLQLCTNSSRFCSMVLQEGAVPPLVALSQSGTPRAKEKAQGLLSYFRTQRHGNAGRA